jgi:ATP citrate (pro-S)-lyase
MSAKAIREFDGKHLLSYWLPKSHESLSPSSDAISSAFLPPTQLASVSFDTKLLTNAQSFKAHVSSALEALEKDHPWLKTTRLVCKPDQLIKRRGKAGLLGINLDWEAVKEWISSRAGTIIKVGLIYSYCNGHL